MLIATIDGWDRIVAIKNTGRKQVYDIEIEATHNFVGNGIVAHNTTGILMRAGASSLQLSSSATSTTADIQLAAADRIDLFASSLRLSTSSTTAGDMVLSSNGSMTFDTSGGTGKFAFVGGNVGIGSTSPVYKLDVNGTLRTSSTARIEGALTVTTGGASVTGDLTLDGDLDFTGPQNITTTADNLTLSPTGNLIIDTSGGTVSIRDAAIDLTNQPTTISGSALTLRSTGNFILDTSANNTNLVLQAGTGGLTGSFGTINLTAVTDSVSALYLNSQRGGITLSSSNASGNGSVRILSGGSLQLSTSQGNQPIYLQAGSGNLNVSSSQLYLTGNLVVTGTETFNGVAYTFPGADGSASNVLTTSGTGLLSWGTLGAASITADSLDFAQFKDELTLDADTSINGDQSLILRIGRGALQDSTGGNNDLQLAAEDKLILAGASFDLSTSSGAVDIISNQRLDLSSGGTLTLDTSANNSNILLKTGSGNINVSTGTLTMTGVLDVRDSTGTLGLVVDSTGNVGVGTTGPLEKLDVSGDIRFAGTASGGLIRFGTDDTNRYLSITSSQFQLGTGVRSIRIFQSALSNIIQSDAADGQDGLEFATGVAHTSGLLYDFREIDTSVMVIDHAGNLGIASTSPAGILDIGSSAAGILLRAGQPGITISSSSAGNTADIQLAAPDRIDMFASSFNLTTSNTSDGSLKLTSYGNLTLDTSQGNKNILLRAGTGTMNVSATTLNLTGNLVSYGTTSGSLGLASDANGNIGIGILTPSYKLHVVGSSPSIIAEDGNGRRLTFRGGTASAGPAILSYSGLLIGGSESAANDLVVASSGNIGIGSVSPSQGLDVRVANSGIIMSTGGHADGSIRLQSGGSLVLDTSGRNSNLLMTTGSGNINVSTGTLTMTGVLDVRDSTGTLGLVVDSTGNVGVGSTAPNNLLEVVGGATGAETDILQLRSNFATTNTATVLKFVNSTAASTDVGSGEISVLRNSGGDSDMIFRAYTGSAMSEAVRIRGASGNLGIGTTSPQGILDVIGNQSVLLRAGQSSLQLSGSATSTTADLQLAAADRIDLFASSLRLSTSSTTAGDMVLASKGSMTFDTSGGTGKFAFVGGNVGIGTTGPSSLLEIKGSNPILTLKTNNNLGEISKISMYGNFVNSADTATREMGRITSGGQGATTWPGYIAFSVRTGDSAMPEVMRLLDGNVGIGTTSPAGLLDTYGDKSILLRAGTGAVSISGGAGAGADDIQLAAEDRIDLFAGSLSLQTSSQTAGELKLQSKGSLILDTSATNAPIVMLGGNVGIGSTSPAYKLDVTGDFRTTTGAQFATTSGNVGIGTTSPVGLLNVRGVSTGKALVELNETGDQAILTASASGTPRFTVGRSDITVNGQKDLITSGMSNVNDVFVYDTTKDLDGGKWRNDERAKASSWYNEAMDDGSSDPCVNDTDDRCGRREFPEKAIIVATGTGVTNVFVYIFDAKDNSMWMRFDQGSYGTNMLSNPATSVFALNGKIYATTPAGTEGIRIFDFISDRALRIRSSTGSYYNNIGSRNNTLRVDGFPTYTISNDTTNDVSAAVICGNGISESTQEEQDKNWITQEWGGGGISDASLDSSTPLGMTGNSGAGMTSGSAGMTGEQDQALLAQDQKIPHSGTLVNLTDSRIDWPDNLENNIANQKGIVNMGVDLPGIGPGRFGLSSQSSEPAKPTSKSILSLIKNQFSPQPVFAGPACKTYVAVATDAGVSVINETDQRVFDYDTASGADAYSVQLTEDGTLYFSEAKNDELAVFTNIQNDTADQTTADRTYDETSGVALWSSAPSITGSASSLTVTQGTSTADGNSNTIYLGHNAGLSVINEKAGDATNGSVKYYTKDYISEEMTGDIRGMWPLYGSGSIADGTNNVDDVSVKSSELTAKNANGTGMTYATGVRGTGIDFDGTDDYLCIDSNDDDTCDDSANTDFTSGSFSIGAWFYVDTNPGGGTVQGIIDKAAVNGADMGYSLVYFDNGGTMTLRFQTNGSGTTDKTGDLSGAWHHAVITSTSGGSNNMYLDGAQVTSVAAGTFIDSAQPLNIGARGAGNVFNGKIDEPFVTAEALTPSQIKHMYEVGKRALQNHTASRIVGVTGADNYQRLMGNASGGTSTSNNVAAVAVDDNNQYIYAGINDATTNTGGVTVIGVNSDSAVDLYDGTANTSKDDDAGTQFSANDVAAISVSGTPCPSYNSGSSTCNNQATLAIAGTNDTATRVWMETADLSLFSTLASVAGTSLYKAGDITAGSALKVMSVTRLSLDTSTAEVEPNPSFIVDQSGNLSVNSFSLDASGGTINIGQMSSTPAASDVVGSLNFMGRSVGSAGQRDITFAGLRGLINDPTDQSEDGELVFLQMKAGTLTEAMRIDESGNVGVGTSSPGAKLDISGSGGSWGSGWGRAIELDNATAIKWQTNSTTRHGIGQTTSGLYFMTANADDTSVASTYSMFIGNTGNIGIASTSPAGILDIGASAAGILLRAGQPGITISSSSAGNTADIQLAAPDRIDLFAGSFSLQTSSQTAGELKLMSKGSLILDTSGAAGGGAPIVMLGGNVGIGTTGPTQRLHVSSGHLIFDGTAGGDLSGFGYGLTFTGGTSGGTSNPGGLITGVNNGAWGTDLQFVTRPAAGGSGVERMRITSTGNIGIGTTSPLGILDVIGNSSVLLRAGTASLQLSGGATSTTADLQLAAPDRIDLFAGRMTLSTSSTSDGELKLVSKGSLILDTSGAAGGGAPIVMLGGSVGIGTTGPLYPLTVSKAVSADTYQVVFNPTGMTALGFIPSDTSAKGFSIVTTGADKLHLGTNATKQLTIDTAGLVGIGTTAPAKLLDVNGILALGDAGAERANLYTTSATAGEEDALIIAANTDDIIFRSSLTGGTDELIRIIGSGASKGNLGIGTTNPDQAKLFVSGGLFLTLDTSGTTASGVCWDNDGGSLLYDCDSAPTDLAENFGTDDSTLEAGDVVVAVEDNRSGEITHEGTKTSKAYISKSTSGYQSSLLGVVSTQPNQLYGDDGLFTVDENPKPVSLVGRVPVKIAPDSLPIKTGDSLTSSDTYPGMAMKATKAGEVIGKALESWTSCEIATSSGTPPRNDNCGKSKIVVFINVGYYMGSMTADGYIDTGLKMKVADIMADTSQESSRGIRQSAETVGISSGEIATATPAGGPRNDGLLSLTQRIENSEQRVVSSEQRITQLEDLVAIMAGFASPELLTQAGTNTLTTSSDPSAYSLLSTPYSLSGSYMDNELAITSSSSRGIRQSAETVGILDKIATLPLVARNDGIDVLGSATIGGNLTVGTTMIGEDGSINGLGCTIDIDSGSGAGMTNECTSLRFQPLALGNIEFMGGKVVMTKEGDMEITGDLKVVGEVTAGKVKAEEVETKRLCIEDVCVTKEELKRLLEGN